MTKALLGVGLLAVPYLAWTSLAETPAPLVQARAAAADATRATPPPSADDPEIQRLPPIDRFSAMVERPLFSADRRPAAVLASLPGPAATGQAVVTGSLDTGSGQPAIKFVGTVGQDGAMTAVVIRSGDGEAVRLAAGDVVDGWEVSTVTTSELILVHEDERLVLTILQ